MAIGIPMLLQDYKINYSCTVCHIVLLPSHLTFFTQCEHIYCVTCKRKRKIERCELCPNSVIRPFPEGRQVLEYIINLYPKFAEELAGNYTEAGDSDGDNHGVGPTDITERTPPRRQSQRVVSKCAVSTEKPKRRKTFVPKTGKYNDDTATPQFAKGDFVLAKMKGHPWWPAQVINIIDNAAKSVNVSFYPDKSTQILPAQNIKMHDPQHYEEQIAKVKKPKLKEAFEALHATYNKSKRTTL